MKTENTPFASIPSNCAQTRLERNARQWLNMKGADYENTQRGAYADLEQGGCISGMVGHLIYSVDCRTFVKRHREEINDLLGATLEDTGCTSPAEIMKDWDASDPFGINLNADRLAWFAFETAARTVAERAGIVE